MFRLYLEGDYIIFSSNLYNVYCNYKTALQAVLVISSETSQIIHRMTISVLSFLVHVIHPLCYVKQTILNAEVSFLTKIDLSTSVADSFLVILLICPTRIMSWPLITGVSIKVIIFR